MSRKPTPTRSCCVPDCPNSIEVAGKSSRGLCRSCYQKALACIRRGRTTWDELEKLGLAHPKYLSDYELRIIEARRRLGMIPDQEDEGDPQ